MRIAGDSSTHLSSPADPPADADPPERLILTIVAEDGDWSGFGPVEEPIEQAAAALARHRHLSFARGREASVVLGSDTLVRRLNKTYRGKDASTNVLSFPYQIPPGAAWDDGAYLGDVVLAAETIRHEATDRGIEPRHHLQHLVVHGLLHLLGYDHQTEAAAERWRAWRPRSWPRSALPTPMPLRPRPDRQRESGVDWLSCHERQANDRQNGRSIHRLGPPRSRPTVGSRRCAPGSACPAPRPCGRCWRMRSRAPATAAPSPPRSGRCCCASCASARYASST